MVHLVINHLTRKGEVKMEPDDVNRLLECLDSLLERLDTLDDALRDHTAAISSLERAIRDAGAGIVEAMASLSALFALAHGTMTPEQVSKVPSFKDIADRIRGGK